MTDTSVCGHGLRAVHNCYICGLEAENTRLKAELEDERSLREAITFDFEGAQANLDDVLERSVKRKEALYEIRNAAMSMFASKDDMIRYMKRAARRALDES